MRSMTWWLAGAVLVLALGASPALAQDPDGPPNDLCPTIADSMFIDSGPMLNMIMQHRRSLGLGELEQRDSLRNTARVKAADILNGGSFEHEINGRNETERARDCGYPEYLFISEIFSAAGGGGVDDQVLRQLAFDTWMGSPLHKGIIEDASARWIGGAAIRQSNGFFTWVFLLGGETPPPES